MSLFALYILCSLSLFSLLSSLYCLRLFSVKHRVTLVREKKKNVSLFANWPLAQFHVYCTHMSILSVSLPLEKKVNKHIYQNAFEFR